MSRFVALTLLSLWIAPGAAAQPRAEAEPAGVAVTVRPFVPRRPPDAPPDPGARYLYAFTLAPAAWPTAEVVADRRLLRFEVRPEGSRRRYRCAHPDSPRSVPEERVVRIGAGAERTRWEEWIDLRMYCWGRALRALDEGGTVEVAYGFPRRGRNRWIARRPSGEDEVRTLGEASFTVSARPEPAAPEGPVRLEMRSSDFRSGGGVSFSVGLHANEGTQRVYVRDDLFSFVVDGPLGRVTCAVPREQIVPIVDFYSRLRGRRAARTSIAAERWCPDGTFDIAGVYDVTPVVDLVYDGSRYEIDAVTGRIEGRPTPVRVRRGDHGYVEQTLDGAPSSDGPV